MALDKEYCFAKYLIYGIARTILHRIFRPLHCILYPKIFRPWRKDTKNIASRNISFMILRDIVTRVAKNNFIHLIVRTVHNFTEYLASIDKQSFQSHPPKIQSCAFSNTFSIFHPSIQLCQFDNGEAATAEKLNVSRKFIIGRTTMAKYGESSLRRRLNRC